MEPAYLTVAGNFLRDLAKDPVVATQQVDFCMISSKEVKPCLFVQGLCSLDCVAPASALVIFGLVGNLPVTQSFVVLGVILYDVAPFSARSRREG